MGMTMIHQYYFTRTIPVRGKPLQRGKNIRAGPGDGTVGIEVLRESGWVTEFLKDRKIGNNVEMPERRSLFS